MIHPYSMYIWQPPLSRSGEGLWIEPVQVYTQGYALYVANLIYNDSRAVIKVVRYLRFVCSKTVKTGEEQQQDRGSADN